MMVSTHYHSKVGELEEGGEEFLCAQTLDQMDEVEFWVRNLERQEKFSFWLQTSTDKFYPDFVCKLKDGRYLVVEYKGADRWSNDDSKEKRRLGELWALKSEGRCLFIMPKGKNWEAMRTLLEQRCEYFLSAISLSSSSILVPLAMFMRRAIAAFQRF